LTTRPKLSDFVRRIDRITGIGASMLQRLESTLDHDRHGLLNPLLVLLDAACQGRQQSLPQRHFQCPRELRDDNVVRGGVTEIVSPRNRIPARIGRPLLRYLNVTIGQPEGDLDLHGSGAMRFIVATDVGLDRISKTGSVEPNWHVLAVLPRMACQIRYLSQ